MIQSYKFSGHESFPCKSLWLKKGYDFVASEKNFNDPSAVVDLGVGKNMVASIRFWLKAFGICDNECKISELGFYLFNDKTGVDKYIEDLATLWLLHFNLVNSQEATLYYLFFCGFQRERVVYSKNNIVDYVKMRMTEDGKQNLYNENTVAKDISVLHQNYVLPRKPQTNEDFSSLLIDLDLIRQSDIDNKEYFFNFDGKRKVVDEIFLYALLNIKGEDNTISYDTIKEKVGYVFCMNDREMIETLKRITDKYSDFVAYNDIAGIRQIQFIKDLDSLKVLNDYYEHI